MRIVDVFESVFHLTEDVKWNSLNAYHLFLVWWTVKKKKKNNYHPLKCYFFLYFLQIVFNSDEANTAVKEVKFNS